MSSLKAQTFGALAAHIQEQLCSISQIMRACIMLAVLLFPLTSPAAVFVGLTDTFSDGTTMGWTGGTTEPVPPANIATGGPAGTGDRYLQINAVGGSGPGSRLVIFNSSTWTGNYLSAGVSSLTMNLRNGGITDLNIRLALNGPGGWFTTSSAVPVPSGSGWTSAAFSLDQNDLVSAGGDNLLSTLGAVSSLRILSNADPTFRGEIIVGQLGLDNITAVPEASQTGIAAGILLLGFAGFRLSRKQKIIRGH